MLYATRDRDGKFVTESDAALRGAGARVIATAPQAPNQNAFVERWGKSLREECLRHFIVFGRRHFDFLVSSYADYYNRLRPHQGVGNRLLSGPWPDVDDPLQEREQIVCHAHLGGLLKHYERRAV
jgi:putative transposase